MPPIARTADYLCMFEAQRSGRFNVVTASLEEAKQLFLECGAMMQASNDAKIYGMQLKEFEDTGELT
jgi:hypothetical protein